MPFFSHTSNQVIVSNGKINYAWTMWSFVFRDCYDCRCIAVAIEFEVVKLFEEIAVDHTTLRRLRFLDLWLSRLFLFVTLLVPPCPWTATCAIIHSCLRGWVVRAVCYSTGRGAMLHSVVA